MPPILPFYYLCQINPQKIMELLRTFYHPDHASTELSTSLGSSSWITDGSGNAIQHLHYLPFGEDWVDQRNTSWNAPYTFSGKEKDTETGYSYFGARYYDSGLSIWLSVDPMSDKYPSMSPYNYCANNPVILVDPDGRSIYILGLLYKPGTECPLKDSKGKDVSNTAKFIWNALETINNHKWGNKVIQELSSSTSIRVDFKVGEVKNPKAGGQTSRKKDGSRGSNIVFRENGISDNIESITKVAHELFHAYQISKGLFKPSIFKEVDANLFTGAITYIHFLYPTITGPDDAEGLKYLQDVNSLLMDYDYSKMDDVVNLFQKRSKANATQVYDPPKYILRNSTNQRSLLENFPSLN